MYHKVEINGDVTFQCRKGRRTRQGGATQLRLWILERWVSQLTRRGWSNHCGITTAVGVILYVLASNVNVWSNWSNECCMSESTPILAQKFPKSLNLDLWVETGLKQNALVLQFDCTRCGDFDNPVSLNEITVVFLWTVIGGDLHNPMTMWPRYINDRCSSSKSRVGLSAAEFASLLV